MNRTARTRALTALILVVAAGATACDIFGPGENTLLREQLAHSEQLWQQRGFADYTMVVTRGALYEDGHRTVELEVRGGQVVAGVRTEDGTALTAAELAEHQTVPGLFDVVREALDRRAPLLFVRYDDEFGYPSLIQVDYDPTRLTTGLYVSVTDLEAITD